MTVKQIVKNTLKWQIRRNVYCRRFNGFLRGFFRVRD